MRYHFRYKIEAPLCELRCKLGDLRDERGRSGVMTEAEAFRGRVDAAVLEPVIDAADEIRFGKFANLNEAMREQLLSVIETHLLCVGHGPTLEYCRHLAELERRSTWY